MIPRTITLKDNDLALRPTRIEDAPALVQAVQESISEIMPWMSWCTPDYNEATALGWLASLPLGWQDGTQYGFAITRATDDRFLGAASLNHINPAYRLANLGYWVRTSATCRGIGSRAAQLVARFGVEKLRLLRAEIVVGVGNQPSLRTAEKAGARPEGVLRNRLVVRDRIMDAVMHALTPQDFGISPAGQI